MPTGKRSQSETPSGLKPSYLGWIATVSDRELERLEAVRRERIFKAVFQVERLRFDQWISEGEGFLSKMGRWLTARQTVMSELQSGKHVDAVLENLGYSLVENCWAIEGRRTYVNHEDADRDLLADLGRTLSAYGWKRHKTKLRSFSNDPSGELIEIEPVGAQTSGHFVHYLKSE
jgi:hypothetical protein